ncbi:MAG TPA: hypothetical protein DIV86_01940 [Alphaproteobacteria bacterium]|nr:hypothetical protein [Alphaproteobacteria bacterium]
MKNIILVLAASMLLTNCSWIWEKAEKLGSYMPVKDGVERCSGGVYCGSRNGGNNAPQTPDSNYSR